jgi:hypothetical protein
VASVILYSLSCSYVWQLVNEHTYDEHSVLFLKLGVIIVISGLHTKGCEWQKGGYLVV